MGNDDPLRDPTAPEWDRGDPSQGRNQDQPGDQAPTSPPTEPIDLSATAQLPVPPPQSWQPPAVDSPPTNPYAPTTPPPPPPPPGATASGPHWPQAFPTPPAGAQAGNPYAPPTGPPTTYAAPAPGGYGRPPAPANVSAIVLVVMSSLLTLACCLPVVPALVIGIVALTKNNDDPVGSRRLAAWGWVAWAIGVVLALVFIAWLFIRADSSGSGYSY
ncbi:MAG: hypothetical protein ACK5MP_04440 [Nostocoides sp.]